MKLTNVTAHRRNMVPPLFLLMTALLLAYRISAHGHRGYHVHHHHHHHHHDHDHGEAEGHDDHHHHHEHDHEHEHPHGSPQRKLQFGSQGQYRTMEDWYKTQDFRDSGARCGTHTTEEERANADRRYLKWLDEHDCTPEKCEYLENMVNERRKNRNLQLATDVVIDTYWHNIKDGNGGQFASDQMITDSMTVLNAAFTDLGFYFNLVNTSVTDNASYWGATSGTQEELDMKTALRVGDCTALNIYSNGQTSILGWAAFPWDCVRFQVYDGIVISYNTMPGGTSAPFNEGDTLTHEVGHWLGIFHTFEGGCNSPGDYVYDTPPEAEPDYICEQNRFSCGNSGTPDDVSNFMNYSPDNCMDHFSWGQLGRMHTETAAHRIPNSPTTPFPTSPTGRLPPAAYKPHPPAPWLPTPPTNAPVAPVSRSATVPNVPKSETKETNNAEPASADDSFCFSEVATVPVQFKGATEMSNLRVGDVVQTASGYAPIYGFAHNDTTTKAKFLQIHTENANKPLEITGEHLLYLANQSHPVRADSVRVGQFLANEAEGTKVTRIGTVTRKGLYAPLTPDGTLVVDGIVSSCYVSLQDDAEYVMLQGGTTTAIPQNLIVHMWLAPVRMACLGVSKKLCESFDEESGLAHFAKSGFALVRHVDQQNVMVQVLYLILYLSVLGAVYAFECMTGPGWSICVLAACFLAAVAHRTTGFRVRLSLQKQKGD